MVDFWVVRVLKQLNECNLFVWLGSLVRMVLGRGEEIGHGRLRVILIRRMMLG